MTRRSRRRHGAVSKGAVSLGADIPRATSFRVFRMWVVRRRTLANDGSEGALASRQKMRDQNRIDDDERGWHQPARGAADLRRHLAALTAISDMHRGHLDHRYEGEDVAGEKKSVGE